MKIFGKGKQRSILGIGLGTILLAVMVFAIGCSERVNDNHGISIQSLRLTAAGYMLDLRYKVLDPEKARSILNRNTKIYLEDESTGAKLIVPKPPKVGSLRQSTSVPTKNRNYFAMFANPGQFIKAGTKLRVVFGDYRSEAVTVE